MTLFTLLLVLISERLFKRGEHWQLDARCVPLFRRVHPSSLLTTLLITGLFMAVTGMFIHLLQGVFFGIPELILWLVVGLFCIGAGPVRLHYHAYLRAASRGDQDACDTMVNELTLIHGVQPDCDERTFLQTLQNALLWINYRFYLAPLFWFVIGADWGPVFLMGYAFLRAWQTWLAREGNPHARLRTGIDRLLHIVDWVPVRLVGLAYALLGHGERALPAWFASLMDFRTSQYQVLSILAQLSLVEEPHHDPVATPKAAVNMAKKVSLVVVVVVALLTLYGALM